MRLWTLHPKYLDARGLVALWREALLAQKVLQGATRGYRHHPQLIRFAAAPNQLIRFAAAPNPGPALAAYLIAVHAESVRRGYHFDAKKITGRRSRRKIAETRGQLRHEWRHLKRKLKRRDPRRWREFASVKMPAPHPSFRIIPGEVRDWEKSR